MKGMYFFIIVFGFFTLKSAQSSPIENEFTADIKAYCKYVEDKNKAKNSTLISPDLIVRAQNATNDYPYQNNVITALSKDLVDFGKSKEVRNLIQDECNYYKLTQEAKLQIQFAIPNVQKQALYFKLKKILIAKEKLNAIKKNVQHKITNHNDTLISLYNIDSSLQKLNEAEREIKANIAIQQPYHIRSMALTRLLKDISMAEEKRQATLNKLEKLRNWSLQVQAGAQQSLSSFSQNQAVKPYAALFLRYNMASIYSNYKTTQYLNDYTEWKAKQVNGTQRKLSRLIQSISLLRATEEQRLNHFKNTHQNYHELTQKLKGITSPNANRFRQQIMIDQIMTEVEMSYLKHLTLLLKELGQ